MKIVEQFKRRILDLAIRGKLVPQDPNDEPASELLARIKAEKEKLIKAGKIKKGKSSAVGSDGAAYEKLVEQTPFEIPKGWAWAQLDELFRFVDYRGKTPHKVSKGIPLITAKNVRQGFIDYSVCEFISKEEFSQRQSRGLSHKGDILFTTEAPLGYIAIADLDVFSTGQRLITLQRHGDTDNHCMMYFMQSKFWQSCLYSKKTGTTVAGIKAEYLKEMFLPVPPLIEQKRIVARIEELFMVADSLGEAVDGLYTSAKRLDKKILDLAIRGKLVPQDPSDEPASELLKRIAITSHKSPCKNHETPIEPPFEIPESWEWVRLGSVSDIVRGTGIKRNETSESGVQCVRYGEPSTDYGYSFSRSVSHVPIAVADKCHEATFGDVLCTLTGENEVEIAKATAYLGKDRLVIGGDLAKITNHPYDPMLLVYFLFSPFMISQKAAVCTGGMIVHMGKSALSNLLIPLPPLAEQKRIVAKIEELRKVTQALTM